MTENATVAYTRTMTIPVKSPWVLFPALSSMDLLLSRILLGSSIPHEGEANPFAAWILLHSGWTGLTVAKILVVCFVLAIVMTIDRKCPKTARATLWLSSILAALVVGIGLHSLVEGFVCQQ